MFLVFSMHIPCVLHACSACPPCMFCVLSMHACPCMCSPCMFCVFSMHVLRVLHACPCVLHACCACSVYCVLQFHCVRCLSWVLQWNIRQWTLRDRGTILSTSLQRTQVKIQKFCFQDHLYTKDTTSEFILSPKCPLFGVSTVSCESSYNYVFPVYFVFCMFLVLCAFLVLYVFIVHVLSMFLVFYVIVCSFVGGVFCVLKHLWKLKQNCLMPTKS